MRRLLSLGLVAMASVALVGCGTDVAESNAPTPVVDADAKQKAMDDMMKHMKDSAGDRGYDTVDSGKYVDEAVKRNAAAPK
ncbi:MAG: hypothetical protein Q8M16_14285 [Pirellulaceae bacterium]|nr:hypothetical protein [Pirellulaceae bacterium]